MKTVFPKRLLAFSRNICIRLRLMREGYVWIPVERKIGGKGTPVVGIARLYESFILGRIPRWMEFQLNSIKLNSHRIELFRLREWEITSRGKKIIIGLYVHQIFFFSFSLLNFPRCIKPVSLENK